MNAMARTLATSKLVWRSVLQSFRANIIIRQHAKASAAAGEGCRIALFGHTHQPLYEKAWNGVILINPGSISLPRQEDRRHGYGILTIEEDKAVLWEQKYLEDA